MLPLAPFPPPLTITAGGVTRTVPPKWCVDVCTLEARGVLVGPLPRGGIVIVRTHTPVRRFDARGRAGDRFVFVRTRAEFLDAVWRIEVPPRLDEVELSIDYGVGTGSLFVLFG